MRRMWVAIPDASRTLGSEFQEAEVESALFL